MVRIDRTIYAAAGETDGDEIRQKAILAIGGPAHWRRIRPLPSRTMRVSFTSLRDLDSDVLRTVSPEVVISPVICPDFDCLDVAQQLSFLGYLGPYRAISARQMQPRIIRREVHALCPALNFDLQALDKDGALVI